MRVWAEALDLVDAAYDVADRMPTTERFELGRQLRRAAVSIVTNIAEGNARVHRGEYRHLLSVARGSAAEVRALAIVAERRRLASPQHSADLQQRCDIVSRMLFRMVQRLSAPPT